MQIPIFISIFYVVLPSPGFNFIISTTWILQDMNQVQKFNYLQKENCHSEHEVILAASNTEQAIIVMVFICFGM